MRSRPRKRSLAWLAAVPCLLLVLLALWLRKDGDAPPSPGDEQTGAARVVRMSGAAPSTTDRSPSPPSLPAVGTGALHEALREDAVRLDSGAMVEAIDMDRPWVCAGEPVRLAARVGGAEPGAVVRWVWMTSTGRAELHPGPAVRWTAPASAGRYTVHFQVCKDLGGRRVGVLAEREVDVEVRDCADSERRDHEPLGIDVIQRRHGVFAFRAVYRGDAPVQEYAWDLGDGTTANTAEPSLEHAYPSRELGPHDVDSYAVTLAARLAGGDHLEARTMVLIRGRPPAHDPPRFDVEVSRWQRDGDGADWHSTVIVRNPDDIDITWERIERVTSYFDDRVDIETHEWRDVITVEEHLGHGGFRGQVQVSASEVPPQVKQIIDSLYGHDAAGEEVVVSWTPFKRRAPARDAAVPPVPPK